MCDECGMGVVEKMPASLENYYTDDYYEDEVAPGIGYGDYAAVAEHGVAWAASLVRLLSKPGRILDIGSADGHLLRKLPDYERFGIEVNRKMADIARSHGIEVIASDIFDPRVLDDYAASFDVISAIALFEHVKDIRRAVDIAARLLRDDGLLLFEVPLVAASGDDSIWFRTSLEHVWYPSERALVRLFELLDLPMTGREVEIVDFASTYVGIVALGDGRAAVESRFRQLLRRDRQPRSDGEAAFRVLMDLVHAGKITPATLALLPSLGKEEANPQLLQRLAALWAGGEEKRSASEASALEAREAADVLENRLQELGSSTRKLRNELTGSKRELTGLRSELAASTRALKEAADEERHRHELAALAAAQETASLAATVAEQAAMLDAIERSRAYRIGLVVRRTKLMFDQVGQLGQRLIRFAERPVRRQRAITASRRRDGPIVSVIMPVYNKGAELLESVDSVRRQTLASWELIVWNDGSTDPATIEAIEKLDGLVGVRVFNAGNRGVIAARNAAFVEARGEFVCCLDADDLISSTYFEKAVLLLDEYPDVAICYPWTRCFGDASIDWRVPDLDPRLIAQENGVPVAAVMRREVLELTGGFNASMKEGLEDWELWAHAAELGFRGRVIPEPLFLYRYSDSGGRDAAARAIHDDLRYRINQLHPGLASPPDKPPAMGSMEPSVRIERTPVVLPTGKGRPVVFFVPWLTRGGGADRFVNDLTRGLIDDGRTVVMIVTLGCPEGMTDATEQALRITPYVYDLTRFIQPETWVAFCRSLVWRLGSPILVNVGSTWLYENVETLRRSARGRVTVVDQLFNEVGHVQSSLRAGPSIDLIITAHHALERLLVEQHGVRSSVVTVPVGIEPPSRNGAARRSARARPVVGWIGRLSVEKRPEWFVTLAAELGNLATFRLVGDGPKRAEVARIAPQVESLELGGFVDDALGFIADCDLLVVTSEIEGIPLVAMEAIALGTPVVATEVGGLADLIEPGINGFLVPSDDLNELVGTIRALLEQPDELLRLQRSVALAGLAERFTASAMLQRFRELLV
jgi:O-antigen biosynthesis protein